MPKKPFDAIIFTTLHEETVFINNHYECVELPYYPKVKIAKNSERSGGKKIGLYELAQMGGVSTASQVTQVFERLLPKCAIITGIAAAYSPKNQIPRLKLGDVGIARSIAYHSFGKIEGSFPYEIRYMEPFSLPYFAGKTVFPYIDNHDKWIALTIEFITAWENQKRLYEARDPKNNISLYKDWIDNGGTQVKQNTDGIADITAKLVSMSSGELVIASREYLEHIRSSYTASDINLFDMESYSVGFVARDYQIPFFAVKGVSDYADSPLEHENDPHAGNTQKNQGKNDEHRLKAIAAASAFCITLLGTQKFVDTVIARSQPIRGALNFFRSDANCFHEHDGRYCPYGRWECIDLSLDESITKQISNSTKVAEGINGDTYSSAISDDLIKMTGEDITVTSFFPYSIDEILNSILSDSSENTFWNKTISDAMPLFVGEFKEFSRLDASEKDILLNFLKVLRILSKTYYMHFSKWNTFMDGSSSNTFSRVLIFPKKSNILENGKTDTKSILNDWRNFVYAALLGGSIPTFCTFHDKIIDFNTKAADVVVIEKSETTDKHDMSFEKCVSFRFFNKASTLLMSGRPCDRSATNDNVYKLYDLWKHRQESRYRNIFYQFPIADVWNQGCAMFPDVFENGINANERNEIAEKILHNNI